MNLYQSTINTIKTYIAGMNGELYENVTDQDAWDFINDKYTGQPDYPWPGYYKSKGEIVSEIIEYIDEVVEYPPQPKPKPRRLIKVFNDFN